MGAEPERPSHFFLRSQAEAALLRGAKAHFPFLPGLLAMRGESDPLSQRHDEIAALVIAGCIHITMTWGPSSRATSTSVINAMRALDQLAQASNSSLLATFPLVLRPLPIVQALLGHDDRKVHRLKGLNDQSDIVAWFELGGRSEPRKQLSALVGKLKFGRAPIFAPNRGFGITRSRKKPTLGGPEADGSTPIAALILRNPLPVGPIAFRVADEFHLPPLRVRNQGTLVFDREIEEDARPKIESPPSARRHLQSRSLQLHRSQARIMARDMARRALHLPCEAALPTLEECRDLVNSLSELFVGRGHGGPSSEGSLYVWLTLLLGCRPSELRFQAIKLGQRLEGFVRMDKGQWVYQRGVSLPDLTYGREMADLLRDKPKRMLQLPLPGGVNSALERFMVASPSQLGFDLVDRDALAREALKSLNSKSTRNWTLDRVASVLPAGLHRLGADRAHVAWILGERPMDAPPTSYSQIVAADIVRTYERALAQLGLARSVKPKAITSSVGSPIILKDRALTAFLRLIGKNKELADFGGPDSFSEYHNRVAIECLIVLALATGHRPVQSPFERIHDFDLDAGWVVIDDKAIGRASSRLVPLCPTALKHARKWRSYLEQVSEAQIIARPTVAQRADMALSGKRPFFFLLENENPKPLTPKAVQEILQATLPLPANWTRHAVSTALREARLSPDIIDACLGHDGLGVGHQSRQSILSHNRLRAFSDAVEAWFGRIGLGEGPV
jgi:integrase